MTLLERLNREGKTIIMVTHSDGVILHDEVIAERWSATAQIAETQP